MGAEKSDWFLGFFKERTGMDVKPNKGVVNA